MGTIDDKFKYLEETKALLRQALEYMGATVTDEDTFRSYAEKFATEATDAWYINLAVKYGMDNTVDDRKVEETVLGGFKFRSYDMICPKIVYPQGCSGEYIIPFTIRGASASYKTSITNGVASYHRVIAPETARLKIFLNMIKPAMLILPDRAYLVQYTLTNGISGEDVHSFTTGLGFGKSVSNSVSTWINRPLSKTKRVVKFPPGFRMDSGSTLYLAKIYITQDCMKEMVQNLYDYIGTGEATGVTRKIVVGSTNRALLTADEISLANNKGWNISTS